MAATQQITTNRLDYELDVERYHRDHGIIRFSLRRGNEDEKPVAVHEATAGLDKDTLLSMVSRTETEEGRKRTWYYLSVPKDRTDSTVRSLQETTGGNIISSPYVPEPEKDRALVLSLLVNGLKICGMTERSSLCMGKLMLLRGDNYGISTKKNERIMLETGTDADGVLSVRTVTFTEVTDTGKKGPGFTGGYYYIDGLKLTVSRELKAGTEETKAYRRGTAYKSGHHVYNQLSFSLDEGEQHKTALVYRLKQLLSDTYPQYVKRLDFARIQPDGARVSSYEETAKETVRRTLEGCTFAVEDEVGTECSRRVAEELSNGLQDGLLSPVKNGKADCLIRIVPPRPEEKDQPVKKTEGKDTTAGEDRYWQRDYPEMEATGQCIQHVTVDPTHQNAKIANAVTKRICKELAIKRMLSLRSIKTTPVAPLYGGWSFSVSRKVDGQRHIGMTMHVTEEGELFFSRLGHPMDVPGSKLRQQSNLLSCTHDKWVRELMVSVRYPDQQQYYAVSTRYNSYNISYMEELALPQYEEMMDYFKKLKELPTWSSYEILEYLESIKGGLLIKSTEEKILDKKEYTVQAVSTLARELRKDEPLDGPVQSKALRTLIDSYPLLNAMKNRGFVDRFFGALVDIHYWSDDSGKMYYVSTESGTVLQNLKLKTYPGLPHLRVITPVRMSRPEEREAEMMNLLSGLQQGFGKAHHGSALPLPFKILNEMCDLYCMKQYGIHWENMNASFYRQWESNHLDGLMQDLEF